MEMDYGKDRKSDLLQMGVSYQAEIFRREKRIKKATEKNRNRKPLPSQTPDFDVIRGLKSFNPNSKVSVRSNDLCSNKVTAHLIKPTYLLQMFPSRFPFAYF